jgi:hypothetical protein
MTGASGNRGRCPGLPRSASSLQWHCWEMANEQDWLAVGLLVVIACVGVRADAIIAFLSVYAVSAVFVHGSSGARGEGSYPFDCT